MRRQLTTSFISLANAAKLYPSSSGNGVSPRTLYRHATVGVRGVKLRIVKSGGRIYTTEAYVHDFLEVLNRDSRSVKSRTNALGDQ